MNKEFIYNSLLDILGEENKGNIMVDEPMKKHISF